MSLVTGERFIKVPEGQSIRFINSDQKLCKTGEGILDSIRSVMAYFGQMISCQRTITNTITSLKDYEIQVKVLQTLPEESRRMERLQEDVTAILKQREEVTVDMEQQSQNLTAQILNLQKEKEKLVEEHSKIKGRTQNDLKANFVQKFSDKDTNRLSSITEEESIYFETMALDKQIRALQEQKSQLVLNLTKKINELNTAKKEKESELGALVIQSGLKSFVVSDPIIKKNL